MSIAPFCVAKVTFFYDVTQLGEGVPTNVALGIQVHVKKTLLGD